jgi:hypothetical protein
MPLHYIPNQFSHFATPPPPSPPLVYYQRRSILIIARPLFLGINPRQNLVTVADSRLSQLSLSLSLSLSFATGLVVASFEQSPGKGD